MGPLVTAQHRDKVTSYLDAGTEAGATLVIDGREGDVDADGEGYFLGPTLFDNVTPRDVDLPGRDLRPGAVGRCASSPTTRRWS